MRMEQRIRWDGNKQYLEAVIIVEKEEESRILDSIFGDHPHDDGLLGASKCECRTSDGYGDHYLLIKNPRLARNKK